MPRSKHTLCNPDNGSHLPVCRGPPCGEIRARHKDNGQPRLSADHMCLFLREVQAGFRVEGFSARKGFT